MMKRKMKGRVRRYADGREVKTFGPIDSDLDTKGTSKVENKKSKRERFNEAFAAARKKMLKEGGPKVFSFEGGKFTTDLASDKKATTTPSSAVASSSSSSTAASSSTTPAKASTKAAPKTTSQNLEARAKSQQSGREALAKARGEPVRYGFQDLFGLTRSAQSRGAAGQARRLESELAKMKAQEKEARAALPGAAAKQKKTPYGFQHMLGLDSESSAVKGINLAVRRQKEIQDQLDELEGKAKGGKVKKYAKGGMASASKRADGCAIRGKTRAR